MNQNKLKYRIWIDAIEPGQMIYPEWVKINKSGSIESENYLGGTLMFSTGLLDKNGKDIYEGDIYNLESWSGNPYFCVWYDGIYWNRSVKDTDESFMKYSVNVSHDCRHDLRGHCKYANIIGNIYENPELLQNAN